MLPFTNLSADPEQQFFCDGLTDEIITDLSRLKKLSVHLPQFEPAAEELRRRPESRASRLGVRYVLDGSVRKAADDHRLAERAFTSVEAFECYHRARQEIYSLTEQASRPCRLARRCQRGPDASSGGKGGSPGAYAFIDEPEQALDWLENAARRASFPTCTSPRAAPTSGA